MPRKSGSTDFGKLKRALGDFGEVGALISDLAVRGRVIVDRLETAVQHLSGDATTGDTDADASSPEPDDAA